MIWISRRNRGDSVDGEITTHSMKYELNVLKCGVCAECHRGSKISLRPVGRHNRSEVLKRNVTPIF